MAQAQRAARVLPHATAIVATVSLAIAAATVTLTMGLFSLPVTDAPARGSEPNPALMRAEQEWERQRHLQSGYVDPIIQSGRDWQRQREQQSP